jgi:hypothetical protein
MGRMNFLFFSGSGRAGFKKNIKRTRVSAKNILLRHIEYIFVNLIRNNMKDENIRPAERITGGAFLRGDDTAMILKTANETAASRVKVMTKRGVARNGRAL